MQYTRVRPVLYSACSILGLFYIWLVLYLASSIFGLFYIWPSIFGLFYIWLTLIPHFGQKCSKTDRLGDHNMSYYSTFLIVSSLPTMNSMLASIDPETRSIVCTIFDVCVLYVAAFALQGSTETAHISYGMLAMAY